MKHEAFKQAEIVDEAYKPSDENYARLSHLNNNEPSTICTTVGGVEGVLPPLGQSMHINELEPQTEIIAKAIADGVETVAEYAHWLGGYTTATKECTKHVKESHDLSWLEPDWKPTSVTYNGEVVK